MAGANVLVVFSSRYGRAEKIALAAGLGAIQAEANIRLRRLADLATADVIASDPAWTENLSRMNMDYVTPRPADHPWADVIVLVMPADSPAEVEAYLTSLRSSGPLSGKIAAPLVVGSDDSALERLCAAASAAGLMVVPNDADASDPIASARIYGRRVSEMARAQR